MKRLATIISIYWVLFWGLNGLDKFCYSVDFVLFKWYGKDRNTQFNEYFDRLNLPQDYVPSFLYLIGIWEIMLSLIFVAAIAVYNANKRKLEAIATLNAVTFLSFCGFDVVAGDRAELLEHSTYFILVAMTFFIYHTVTQENASTVPITPNT